MRPTPRQALLLLAALLASGCVSLKRPYPEQRQFKLSAPTAKKIGEPAPRLVLTVSRFTASDLYQDTEFAYRVSEHGWETDFHNIFILPPAVLLASEVRDTVAGSGIFGHVSPSSSAARPTHVLEGHLRAIYGDASDRAKAKAVLKLELTLLDVREPTPKVLLHRSYEREAPVAADSLGEDTRGAALVEAWNTALAEILTAFIADLGKAL